MLFTKSEKGTPNVRVPKRNTALLLHYLCDASLHSARRYAYLLLEVMGLRTHIDLATQEYPSSVLREMKVQCDSTHRPRRTPPALLIWSSILSRNGKGCADPITRLAAPNNLFQENIWLFIDFTPVTCEANVNLFSKSKWVYSKKIRSLNCSFCFNQSKCSFLLRMWIARRLCRWWLTQCSTVRRRVWR